MYCFTHVTQHAVGLCVSCFKGVCSDCAITNASYLTCDKENCIHFAKKSREIVKNYNIENSNNIIKKSHIAGIVISIMLFTMGILFYSLDAKFSVFSIFGAGLFIYYAYDLITKKYQLFKN